MLLSALGQKAPTRTSNPPAAAAAGSATTASTPRARTAAARRIIGALLLSGLAVARPCESRKGAIRSGRVSALQGWRNCFGAGKTAVLGRGRPRSNQDWID